MATCKDCLHYEACSSLAEIFGTPFRNMIDGAESRCYTFKNATIKTNADRIRAMSDEELAELFGAILREREIILLKQLEKQGIEASVVEFPDETFNAHLEWLKQPAEGE